MKSENLMLGQVLRWHPQGLGALLGADLVGADGLWKLCDFGSASDRSFDFVDGGRKVVLEASGSGFWAV